MSEKRAGEADALRILAAPRAADIPSTPEAFLNDLEVSTLLRVPGRTRGRARAVATLLHGNEPSGIRAVHAWLRSGRLPAVDTLVWIGSVAAALEPPGFALRSLPGARDLNRCFRPPFSGPEGNLARSALAAMCDAGPEALVDLHNTTGHTAAYAVAPLLGAAEMGLASLFGDRLVHYELSLGALAEAASDHFPSVTIECGRAGDPEADEVALRGLTRFLEASELELEDARTDLTVFEDAVRVCTLPGVRLSFGDGPLEGLDITIRRGLDQQNFRLVTAGELIGWMGAPDLWPLDARGADGRDRSRELFERRGDRLVAREELVPIMMTNDAQIAVEDCLFYAVRPSDPEPGSSWAPIDTDSGRRAVR